MSARWSGSCCAACCVVEQEVQRGRAACALHAPVVRIMFLRFILSCVAAVNILPALQPARSGNGRGAQDRQHAQGEVEEFVTRQHRLIIC